MVSGGPVESGGQVASAQVQAKVQGSGDVVEAPFLDKPYQVVDVDTWQILPFHGI